MVNEIKELKSKNPMTGEILWEGMESSDAVVNKAITEASNALSNWSSLSLEERIPYIKHYGSLLKEKADSFSEIISKETGKPLWESKTEVASMIAKIDISIEAQKLRCPDTHKTIGKATSLTRHKPLGVAAVLGPFNFPGHLPNGHIIPALLAGNTIVFKPSELTPLVGETMVNIWSEAGLPDGIINIVQGGPKVGRFLSNSSNINGLFFTGSWKTGKILAEQFGKTPQRLLALEMGGNNPLVIGNISNLEAAAYCIIQSAFLTAGQRCSCTRRLIIPNTSQGASLLRTLIDMAAALKIGPYTDSPEPFMGPLINLHASNHLLTVQQGLISFGAELLLEMKELQPKTPLLSPGIVDSTNIRTFVDEEHFGPLLQVFRVDSFQEAIQEANRTSYGLIAGLLSDDKSQFDQFYKHIRAGLINWNTPTTGASSMAPFGGVGFSGNYRPSALYAADYCNYPVASMMEEKIHIPDKILPGIKIRKE